MILIYIGNFIDFLEFGLFTALLPFITSDLLVNYQPSIKVDLYYICIALGFAGRPIGAFLFGKFGDYAGSQRLLIFSVLGMSISSFALILIPQKSSYVLLMIMLCRLAQGFFTGAEYSAAVISSTHNDNAASNYTSVAKMTASGILGVSCAHFFAFLINYSKIQTQMWRYVIAIISLIGFSVFFLRLFVTTPKNRQKIADIVNKPKITSCLPQIICCTLLMGFINSMFYLLLTFLNTYKMITSDNIITSNFLLNFIVTIVFAASILMWSAYLSKIKHCPFKVLYIGLIAIFLCLIPMVYIYAENCNFWFGLIFQICFAFSVQLFSVVCITMMPKIFPDSIRIQSCGFAFNLGISLIAGVFPYFCLKLTSILNTLYAPLIASLTIMLFAVASLFYIQKNRLIDLNI